jgi:choloylglycine hydrolase
MCTAITWRQYFGRTLDYERSFGEGVTLMPRNFSLGLRSGDESGTRYAVVGMACVEEGFPLFFDGVNEHGLACCALNFPDSARYFPVRPDKINLASFELIPYILASCKAVHEARALLKNVNVADDAVSASLSPSPLHWMIADENECIVAEQTNAGMCVYENPYGVLTNEPPFSVQVSEQEKYTYTCDESFSSRARFCRALYSNTHSKTKKGADNVSEFFSVMDTVKVPYGCSHAPSGDLMYTEYTSCVDLKRCVYYVREYARFCVRRASVEDFYADGNAISSLDFGRMSKVM